VVTGARFSKFKYVNKFIMCSQTPQWYWDIYSRIFRDITGQTASFAMNGSCYLGFLIVNFFDEYQSSFVVLTLT